MFKIGVAQRRIGEHGEGILECIANFVDVAAVFLEDAERHLLGLKPLIQSSEGLSHDLCFNPSGNLQDRVVVLVAHLLELALNGCGIHRLSGAASRR